MRATPTEMSETGEKISAQDEYSKRRARIVEIVDGVEVNASGYKDELQRQYSIWSICGLAMTVDSAWVALGGSIAVAVANGGPPGVLYEFLGSSCLSCFRQTSSCIKSPSRESFRR